MTRLKQSCPQRTTPIGVALASVRENLVPMFVLWVLAGAFVFLYYCVPGGAAVFDPIKDWQMAGGWLAAFLNRVVFLALLPGVFMGVVSSIRPKRLGLTVLAYALWGGAWGVFDAWFYPLLASWFGDGTDFATLAMKTMVGQLVGTIIVGLVPGTLFFRWVSADFSARRVRAEWPDHFFSEACLSLLLANWIVWIPVNVCTYAFPVPLQIQLVGLAGSFWMLVGLAAGARMKRAVAILLLIFAAESADALTVRSKGDLRMWQTVFDRSTPIVWDWESVADAATVTFSNRLTGAVSSRTVEREPAATRGSIPQPVISVTDEALLSVTVVQAMNGVVVSRVAADLAYVPGAASQPIAVRTKAHRDWYRVQTPRLAAFDAAWWDVAGTSGYEVLWREPAGPHCVERAFDGVGVVDEVTLKFGMPGFLLMLR